MLDDNCNYSNLKATIMDQGPNALIAAAAAFAVLGAPHPTTGFMQPVMHTSISTATIYTLLGSIAAAAASHITPTVPRPEQGSERITLRWLHSLSEESCLWRFRLVTLKSDEIRWRLMI
jgi:hypothetical protein